MILSTSIVLTNIHAYNNFEEFLKCRGFTTGPLGSCISLAWGLYRMALIFICCQGAQLFQFCRFIVAKSMAPSIMALSALSTIYVNT